MKKIKYILSFIVITITFLSCGDEFLQTEDLYDNLDENFYSNPEEIQDALTGAYTCLANDAGADNATLVASILSDDRLGGGGTNDLIPHGVDQFDNYQEDSYLEIWEVAYQGIFRTNMIINRFNQAVYDDEQMQNRDLGEAHLLRGFFYLRLAQLFGTVPLVLDPAPENLPRAEPAALFGQIISDLKTAIELMPSTKVTTLPPGRDGHATKWTAEGLIARAFLFYTGYYNQSDITLPDGGTVTQQDVIGWLDDCVANSGHDLVDDFRNLWPYTYSETDYAYNDNYSLNWVGDGNIESMFAIKYSPYGGWNVPDKLSYSNQMSLYSGMRGQDLMPFGQGWGFGPVNPQLWDSFEDGDIRQQGSILNVVDDVPGEDTIKAGYVWGGALSDPQYDETGYWIKKYMPVIQPTATDPQGIFYVLYGGEADFQLWNMQDEVLLRFADVLLMGAELGSGHAQEYMDRIRTRAGLGSVAPTLENIKSERRHEFAGEGLRYFDLLRWHDAEAAFEAATNIGIGENQDEIYTVTFNPGRTFLKIPESQILLSAGVLEQSEGWR